jgi:transposase
MAKDNSKAVAAAVGSQAGDVRLRRAERNQILMQMACCDDLIPLKHQARVIWSVVAKLDLSAFYEPIKARACVCGRDMTDPAILISLWLYASTRGEGSARELARLCAESKPYQWLCGGVSLNNHTLSDFRTDHAAALDELFTQVLASLVDLGLVKVHRISQDGTRVRACAGAASFRGDQRLDKLLEEAKQHVEDLAKLLDDPEKSSKLSAKKKAAQRRAAREKVERIEQAVARLPELRDRQTDRAKRDQVAAEAAAAEGVTLFVPPKTPADPGKLDQRYIPKPDDTPAQADWRKRMGTPGAKTIYKERASTIETVNADLKTHRGMVQFLVRGIEKVKCVALWSALAYNLLHFGKQMIV